MVFNFPKIQNIKIFIVFFLLLFCARCFGADFVNINNASLDELDRLVGIGPAIGQRIIDSRPYSSIDDLDRVKGIGSATIQKIKDQGLACIDCPVLSQKEPAGAQISVNANKALPKIEKSVKNNIEEAGLADISLPAQAGQAININQEEKQKSPWFLFFTTLGFAIIMASVTLLIKLKIFNHVRT